METKGIVINCAVISPVVKIEPGEVDTECDCPVSVGPCSAIVCKEEATEGIAEPSTSNMAAGECPIRVKTETEFSEYSLDIEYEGIKQESTERAEAVCAAGAGVVHLRKDAVPELASPSSSYSHLEVNNTSQYQSLCQYSTRKESTNQETYSSSRCSSSVKLEPCSIESEDLCQSVSIQTQDRMPTVHKLHACLNCREFFTELELLHQHIKTNSCKQSNTFDNCQTSVSYSRQLKRNIKIQTKDKPHTCQECGKAFHKLHDLLRHTTIHTGVKPYTCQECGKTFSQSGNLYSHMAVHTVEKPHTCQECGKSFHRQSDLHRHMTVHTGEKHYTCKECGKAFTQSGSLRSHMTVHTGVKPHTCQECGKTFAVRRGLCAHLKIHTGEKPHTCQECGKSFTRLGHLRSHMTLHIGENPHTCHECGKSFSQLSNLRRHIISHTGEKSHNV